MSVQHDVTRRLDEFEESLPSIPSNIVRLGRSAVHRSSEIACAASQRIRRVADTSATTADVAATTTYGQARSAAERTLDSADRGAREVAGQARAQARRTAAVTQREVDDALADAVAATAPADLDDMTKSELYAHAQELDIDGRSEMNKSQLRSAVASRL